MTLIQTRSSIKTGLANSLPTQQATAPQQTTNPNHTAPAVKFNGLPVDSFSLTSKISAKEFPLSHAYFQTLQQDQQKLHADIMAKLKEEQDTLDQCQSLIATEPDKTKIYDALHHRHTSLESAHQKEMQLIATEEAELADNPQQLKALEQELKKQKQQKTAITETIPPEMLFMYT